MVYTRRQPAGWRMEGQFFLLSSIINGFTKLLEKGYKDKPDDEGKRLMSVVTDNSTKMGRLIDDLLEFSRLGKKEMKKTNIDIAEMVNLILDDLNNTEGNNKLNIIVKNLLPIYGVADYCTRCF